MRWTSLVRGLVAHVVTRPRCAICDVAFEVPSCGQCQDQLPWLANSEPTGAPFAVVAAWRYEEPVAGAIRRLKYNDRPDLARALVSVAAPALRPALDDPPDLIVPVPLHPHRLAERGYNQAALLARALAHQFETRLGDATVAPRALQRICDTGQLAGTGRSERQRRVIDAFDARPAVHGRRVLLVDDVVTTGATLVACASALRRGGARVGGALALCRTESGSLAPGP
jgi:ComF family protein